MKNKTNGFFYWLPRGLGVLMILFIGLFSLDVFELPGAWWVKLGGFLIHNLPTFLLVGLLLLSWRWEWVGAIS